jgi:hypothetical protein
VGATLSSAGALTGNFPAGLHWKRHLAASGSPKMISFANRSTPPVVDAVAVLAPSA